MFLNHYQLVKNRINFKLLIIFNLDTLLPVFDEIKLPLLALIKSKDLSFLCLVLIIILLIFII